MDTSWTRKAKALVLLLGIAVAVPVAADPAPEPLILAVHPYLPTAEINRRFGPLANEIASVIKRPVVVRVGRNYEEHLAAIGGDNVEIAYLGPALYVNLVARYGAKPLLARQVVNGDPMLHGEIVVREDSAIRTLQDLKGKRFAFGDPASTDSSILPQAMLRGAGVPPAALAGSGFLGSHRNVALAVLAGDYDAGAVKEEVFAEFAAKGLRSIAHEPGAPDHVFVASGRLAPPLVTTLRRILLDLPRTPRGMAILRAIHPGMSDLVAAQDSDYDSLRKIMHVPAPGGRGTVR